MLSITVLLSFAGTVVKFLLPERMSDKELVTAVCSNDQRAIVHMFYKKYMSTFQYHVYKLFPYKEDVRDLVDEFFLYLYEDDWRRLKTFDGSKASLSTWMSVTSFRFFKNYKRQNNYYITYVFMFDYVKHNYTFCKRLFITF